MKQFLFVVLFFGLNLAQARPHSGAQGGVTHSPVRDQENSEICWAFTVNGLVEAEFHKSQLAADIPASDRRSWEELSPMYLSFYHFYFQVRDNLEYFAQLKTQIEAGNVELKDSVDKTYALMKSSRGLNDSTVPDSEPPSDLFVPDVGNIEKLAMRELAEAGLMPESQFHAHITDEETEAALEKSIPTFIYQNIFSEDSSRLALYKKTARHGHSIGTNDPLYQDLQKLFISQLQVMSTGRDGKEKPLSHVPTPNESFSFNEHNYTPRVFMTKYLKFNPHRFVSRVMTLDTAEESLAAIVDNLKHNYTTPIGIMLFADVNSKNTQTATELATESGIFDDQYCSGPLADDPDKFSCHKDGGGHEMLAVNWIESDEGKITGLIVKNSWGNVGRDVDGNTLDSNDPEQLHRLGYYIITAEWLRDSANPEIGSPYDFILNDDVAARHPKLQQQWIPTKQTLGN